MMQHTRRVMIVLCAPTLDRTAFGAMSIVGNHIKLKGCPNAMPVQQNFASRDVGML